MASPSYLGPPVAGSGIASAKVGGSGTANLPPDVAARFKQARDKMAQFGTQNRGGSSSTGPGLIGPPDTLPPGPGLIGPPATLPPGPSIGGVPPSMGGGYADVMRILMGGSNPNVLTGQSQPYPSFGFPRFSNLLLNWGGGYNG